MQKLMNQCSNDNYTCNIDNAPRSSRRSTYYDYCPDAPMPELPRGGAIVRVVYAGACYNENPGKKNRRVKSAGYEISGIVEAVCQSVPNCNWQMGDKCIIYNDQASSKTYANYMAVDDVNNLIRVPTEVPMEIAAMLPSGGLLAYAAVTRALPYIQYKLQMIERDDIVTFLVVGAGGLGLWTIRLAQYLLGDSINRVHLTVADTNAEKLLVARDHGCYGLVHWSDALHEEYLVERTRDACPHGIDVVIDFVGSRRTMTRSKSVLNKFGVIFACGNSDYDMTINLFDLAQNEQSIVGTHSGTREQLQCLMDLLRDGRITPPTYATFPIEQADSVFRQLSECRIAGRAVFRVSATDL